MKLVVAIGVVLGLVACSSKEGAPEQEVASDPTAAQSAAEAATATVAPSASVAQEPVEQVLSGSASASASADPDAQRRLALEAARKDAMDFGMIGLMSPSMPSDAWGKDDKKNMWGDEIGEAYGAGGLGLSGVGEGAGRGEAGLGTIGHGSGAGVGGDRARSGKRPSSVRIGATTVSGRLPPEVIQRIARQNLGRFRLCYETGLKKDPKLAGRVSVSFTIKEDGSVKDVKGSGDMPDADVVSCVAKAFNGLSFPAPEGGIVKVTYPIAFTPGDEASTPATGAGGTTTGPTIGGKLLTEATVADVEKALRAAGCTDVSSKTLADAKNVVVFTAKKAEKTYTVTFVPASAGASALPQKELERLEKTTASIRKSGAFFLAVEGDDKPGNKALLDELIKGT